MSLLLTPKPPHVSKKVKDLDLPDNMFDAREICKKIENARHVKELHFVTVDINVDAVRDLPEYAEICHGFDKRGIRNNQNLFIGCAIPLPLYEELCIAISKIMKKGEKKKLYYGLHNLPLKDLDEY